MYQPRPQNRAQASHGEHEVYSGLRQSVSYDSDSYHSSPVMQRPYLTPVPVVSLDAELSAEIVLVSHYDGGKGGTDTWATRRMSARGRIGRDFKGGCYSEDREERTSPLGLCFCQEHRHTWLCNFRFGARTFSGWDCGGNICLTGVLIVQTAQFTKQINKSGHLIVVM